MSVDLQLRRVAFGYRRGATIIDEVGLDVPAGALTTMLGPSGSGKSTLLSLIAGTHRPWSGDILIDGASLLGVEPAQRGVGLVLQQPYLFPHMSVGENVAFGLAARGVSRDERGRRADDWLARVGLAGMADRRPRELSGGEQQRVALVRALIVEPRLLLLDEPLASLDRPVREALQQMLRAIVRDTGVTTLLVTHDLTEAMALGDQTAVISAGRIAAHGPSADIFRRPGTRPAAELLGVTTFLSGLVAADGVDTQAGRLAVDVHAPIGVPVTLAIRPEHLRLADAGTPNTIAGVVVRSVFRGEFWDVAVESAAGTLTARVDSAPAAGSRCHVVLPAAHLFALTEDTPQRDG